MFGISNVPDTPRNRIAALVAIVLGLGVGFYMSVSDKNGDEGTIEVTNVTATTELKHSAAMMPLEGADPDMSLYSADMAANIGLIAGVEQSDADQIIKQWFNIDLNDEIRPKIMQDTINIGSDKMLMHAMIENMRGNPITDKEVMVIIEDGKVLKAGLRVICARGENAGRWQRELCR